jgi:hypothetical protein
MGPNIVLCLSDNILVSHPTCRRWQRHKITLIISVASTAVFHEEEAGTTSQLLKLWTKSTWLRRKQSIIQETLNLLDTLSWNISGEEWIIHRLLYMRFLYKIYMCKRTTLRNNFIQVIMLPINNFNLRCLRTEAATNQCSYNLCIEFLVLGRPLSLYSRISLYFHKYLQGAATRQLLKNFPIYYETWAFITHRVHKNRSFVNISNHMNPVRTNLSSSAKIHLNIIIPPTSRTT